MSDNSGSAGGTLLVMACLAAWGAHSGLFYQTGKQWFEACWQAQHSKDGPKTPEEAISWGKCEYTAKKALFDAGFVFAGEASKSLTPAMSSVLKACPSGFSDISIAGPQIQVVDMIEAHGGTQLVDSFAPAPELIARTFKARWPSCVSAVRANGFPRLVEKVAGQFEWESPCKPCADEQAAEARAEAEEQKRQAASDQSNMSAVQEFDSNRAPKSKSATPPSSGQPVDPFDVMMSDGNEKSPGKPVPIEDLPPSLKP